MRQIDKSESSRSVLKSTTLKENLISPYLTRLFNLWRFAIHSKGLQDMSIFKIQKLFKRNSRALSYLSTFSLLTMLLNHTPLDKNSCTPVHELPHWLSMLLDIKFIYLIGIFYWVSFPPYQILQISLSHGLLTNTLINDLLLLWIFHYKSLLLPLNPFLIFWFFCVIFPIRIQV